MLPNRLVGEMIPQINTHITISDFLYVMRYINHLYIGDLKTKGLWPVSAMSVPYWRTAMFWKAQHEKKATCSLEDLQKLDNTAFSTPHIPCIEAIMNIVEIE